MERNITDDYLTAVETAMHAQIEGLHALWRGDIDTELGYVMFATEEDTGGFDTITRIYSLDVNINQLNNERTGAQIDLNVEGYAIV